MSLSSPGFIYEPYEPREKIPFWKRLDLSGFRSIWFIHGFSSQTISSVVCECVCVCVFVCI